MAEKLDEKELVSFRELLMSNTIQVDTVTQLLMEKRVFTEDEFYAKLKEVADGYREKLGDR
jgi:AmiR/NasT family two-component response regulator